VNPLCPAHLQKAKSGRPRNLLTFADLAKWWVTDARWFKAIFSASLSHSGAAASCSVEQATQIHEYYYED
jgi:hypothetical protein